jgi:MinD-like ATPase involved in chromosome partitioning or flagellar assembly
MTAFTKRVVFTMGGKGGVGKTGVIVAFGRVVRGE